MLQLLLLVGTIAASTTAPRGHHLVKRSWCSAYFDAWNAHDVNALRMLFADNVRLRDWDVDVSGIDAVAKANAGIFASAPRIAIEILQIHLSDESHSAVCEILVRVNDAASTVLRVVDVIEFDTDGKILAVRAYKG